ncbi:MAG: TetR/AcrR family transcriptional regulator [Microbispora sp.]|nr:TetR/AcrR family transcriptional regulator [Microbispora sp.]
MAARSSQETEKRRASRRETLREQLIRDVKEVARELIASEGVEGLTLTAVAQMVGVTPPALYRYFDGKRGLVKAVYDDLADELVAMTHEAVQRQDPDDISAKLHAATRAVMAWSVANRAGFNLLMGASYRMAESEAEVAKVIPITLGGVYGELFLELTRSGRLEFRRDEQIAPELRPQLAAYRDAMNPDLPLGVAYLMITCWRQIYGLLSMAVHGHLGFAFEDPEPLFEDMIEDLLALLGLHVSPRLR